MRLYVKLLLLSTFVQSCGQSGSFQQTKQSFHQLLLQENWDEPNKIIDLAEPFLLLETRFTSKTGCSKLGGTPDLPPSLQWPEFENKPMVFFGQLNLEEISTVYPDSDLPKKGMLYFFCYFENPEGDFGASYDFIKPKSEYAVIFYENTANDLAETEFPHDLVSEYHFKEKPIAFELQFQLPPTVETARVELAKLTANDLERYDNFIADNYLEETILGTPHPIQGGVAFEWALNYMNVANYDQLGINGKIAQTELEFINLFSFSMEDRFEAIGLSFCYFGIHIKDLNSRKFSNTVFIMQDT